MILALLPAMLWIDQIQLDAFSVHVETEGKGSPVVFISGLGNRLELWDDVFRHLDGVHKIRFDNRGIGTSGDHDGPYSVDTMAHDTAELMSKLGHDRYAVVGISLGGFVAQRLALQHPDRVTHLVLIATSLGGSAHQLPDQEVLTFFQTMATLPREEKIQRGLDLSVYPDFMRDQPERIDAIKAFFRSYEPDPGVIQRQAAAGMFFTSQAEAADIKAATLIIHGMNDRIVPVENARRLHAAIPDSRLITLEASGHLCILDQAQRVASVIAEFLE